MPSIFLSHSSEDKLFVQKLAERLKHSGVSVWLDEAEINIGDSLTEKVGQAIDETDFMGVVLSHNSINSEWVQRELQVAMQREFMERKIVVLPFLLEPVEIPPFLRDKHYADFTIPDEFEKTFIRLLRTLGVAGDGRQKAPEARHEPRRSRLKKVPRWGWGGLAVILLLILLWGGHLWYIQWKSHQSPNKFVVLVADFHQIDTESDPNAMTDKLIHSLRAVLAGEPKAEVVSLGQPISIREPSSFARKIGSKHKATIVIWGTYAATPAMVDLWVHFEVLEKPALLPVEVERAGEIGMEIQFNREQWESLELRDRVVNELIYLTMFTLGLSRSEVDDTEYAIAHFSSALAQAGERSPMQMAPLNQCIVYFFRGKAHYDKGNSDQAITDFDNAIFLCPDYAAAYRSRGSVYYDKEDYPQAFADWSKSDDLQIKLLPAH